MSRQVLSNPETGAKLPIKEITKIISENRKTNEKSLQFWTVKNEDIIKMSEASKFVSLEKVFDDNGNLIQDKIYSITDETPEDKNPILRRQITKLRVYKDGFLSHEVSFGTEGNSQVIARAYRLDGSATVIGVSYLVFGNETLVNANHFYWLGSEGYWEGFGTIAGFFDEQIKTAYDQMLIYKTESYSGGSVSSSIEHKYKKVHDQFDDKDAYALTEKIFSETQGGSLEAFKRERYQIEIINNGFNDFLNKYQLFFYKMSRTNILTELLFPPINIFNSDKIKMIRTVFFDIIDGKDFPIKENEYRRLKNNETFDQFFSTDESQTQHIYTLFDKGSEAGNFMALVISNNDVATFVSLLSKFENPNSFVIALSEDSRIKAYMSTKHREDLTSARAGNQLELLHKWMFMPYEGILVRMFEFNDEGNGYDHETVFKENGDLDFYKDFSYVLSGIAIVQTEKLYKDDKQQYELTKNRDTGEVSELKIISYKDFGDGNKQLFQVDYYDNLKELFRIEGFHYEQDLDTGKYYLQLRIDIDKAILTEYDGNIFSFKKFDKDGHKIEEAEIEYDGGLIDIVKKIEEGNVVEEQEYDYPTAIKEEPRIISRTYYDDSAVVKEREVFEYYAELEKILNIKDIKKYNGNGDLLSTKKFDESNNVKQDINVQDDTVTEFIYE